jgi:hypothetical protein
VATWPEFAMEWPELAALGRRIMTKYKMAYLATVRADGAPRVHPICPVILDRGAYIGIIPSTPKRRDLDRDGRFVLHALPGPQDVEFSIRGTVRRMSQDEVVRLRDNAPENVRISLETAMYELMLDEVVHTTYNTDGDTLVPVRTICRLTDLARPTGSRGGMAAWLR